MNERHESFRWLAGVIYAQERHEIGGRLRLQKMVWFLQRCGMPTNYSYTMYHYGPYSEDVQAEISTLRAFELVEETPKPTQDGNTFYLLHAKAEAELPALAQFADVLDVLKGAHTDVLELAATYDYFRRYYGNHERAVQLLNQKKGHKCTEQSIQSVAELMARLKLSWN